MISGNSFLCCARAGVEENKHLQNISSSHSWTFLLYSGALLCEVLWFSSYVCTFFFCLIIWVAFLNCIFISILLYRLLLLPHLFHKLLPYQMLLVFFLLFTPPFYLIFKMKISLLFSEYKSNTCSSFSNSNNWKD